MIIGVNIDDRTTLTKIPIKLVCGGYYVRWYYNGFHYWFFRPGQTTISTEGEDFRTIGTRKISMGSGQITRDQALAIRTIFFTREVALYTSDGWKNIRIEPRSNIVYDNQLAGAEIEFTALVGSKEISGYSGFSPVNPVPPDADKFYITHHTTIFTMTLTGDGTVVINWGDGTTTTVVLVPGVPQVITHTYTDGVTEHVVTIDGEENITEMDVSGNHITEIIIPPTAIILTTLIVTNNDLTENPVIPPTVPLIILEITGNPLRVCEVQIGTQVWLCKNYDSNYPNSKAYNDDPANVAIYGRLYSFSMVNNPGFCPPGWHVPTLADITALFTYLGSISGTGIGGKLKEVGTTHWTAPNTDAVDTYGFGARGAGFYGTSYLALKEAFDFWVAFDDANPDAAFFVNMIYDGGNANLVYLNALTNYMFSVRLVKNFAVRNIVTDIDGNTYNIITIGTQQWLVENLKTTKYADGTPIPNLTVNADWLSEDGTPGHNGAYCWYNNDEATYKADYGALYNWYAVNNAHGLAIAGWRIPTDADLTTLTTYLGGLLVAGGHMKESGTAHWITPNTGADNTSGLTVYGSGIRRNTDGVSDFIQTYGTIWSATSYNATLAYIRWMYYNHAYVDRTAQSKITGASVRCMRDV